jgi:hypothetical protein
MFLFHGVHPKKNSAPVLVLTLLFTALAGSLFVDQTAANPLLLSLEVEIISPQSEMYNQSVILVAFTYHAPREIDVPVNSLPNHYYYDLDGQKEVPFTPVLIGSSYCFYFPFSNGVHTLTVHVTAWEPGQLIHYWGYSTVTFNVDPVPRIDVISPRDTIYDNSDVQLRFLVDQPVSRAAYSLDENENVTVALSYTVIEEVFGSNVLTRGAAEGSDLLTGMASGKHAVTVYAWGEGGNVGNSEAIFFTVGDSLQKTPSPSKTSSPPIPSLPPPSEPETPTSSPPSSTPPSQPSEETLETSSVQRDSEPFPTEIIMLVVVLSATSISLVTYLVKFKRKRSK